MNANTHFAEAYKFSVKTCDNPTDPEMATRIIPFIKEVRRYKNYNNFSSNIRLLVNTGDG